MLNVIKDLAIFVLVFLLGMFLLALLTFYPVVVWPCHQYEVFTGIKTKVSFFDACYVETKTGWMRWDEYKARSITNQERK